MPWNGVYTLGIMLTHARRLVWHVLEHVYDSDRYNMRALPKFMHMYV